MEYVWLAGKSPKPCRAEVFPTREDRSTATENNTVVALLDISSLKWMMWRDILAPLQTSETSLSLRLALPAFQWTVREHDIIKIWRQTQQWYSFEWPIYLHPELDSFTFLKLPVKGDQWSGGSNRNGLWARIVGGACVGSSDQPVLQRNSADRDWNFLGVMSILGEWNSQILL